MPSWKIHKKWAKIMGIPEHIVNEVNRIIDSGPIHDLGEVKKYKTHIGDMSIPLRPQDTCMLLKMTLMSIYPDRKEYILAAKAAILHHILDKIERILKEHGALAAHDPTKLVKYAYEDRRNHLICLEEELFPQVLNLIQLNAHEIIDDILKESNINTIGPSVVVQLLTEYVKHKKIKGVISIPSHMDRPLPVAAAARKIYTLLKQGEKVTIILDKIYEFTNIKDLVSTLLKELRKNIQITHKTC